MQIDYRQAAEIIKACDNIHILTHQSPDGDTMGSGFALYFALKKMNKKAAVIMPDGLPARYEFLSEGYEEPESFEPDSVIAVDIADPNLLGDLKNVYADRVDLCVDHHISNIMYAKNTLLNGKASAACEVLYCLFEELGLELDARIAKCLYTGIATDTGCFKFSNSSREAHEIAGKLIGGYDFDFARINREMFDIKSRARIKLEQHLLGNMNMYCGDRIAVITVTEELRQNLGVPEEEFDGVAGLPLQIQGVEVAVTIKEKKPDEYKVSMRSAGKVNVSAVCGQFGGGGHYSASGCLVKASLEDAEKQLVAAVEKAIGELMNGILCINKPQGFTSFDVVAKLRGILKTKKIGHAGTLDPMATGVLPVFVGNATKACDIMPDSSKAYRASFKLGEQTDTQDSSGTVLKTSEANCTASDIEKLLPEFTGDIMQVPPMYSAVSVNGKRLYELARQGIEVEREPRQITVFSLVLEEYSEETKEGVFYIECSKGTYIRTIIHDIGIKLGCGGVMTALVRTVSNGFELSGTVTLDEVQKLADEGKAESLLLPVERVFEELPALHLNANDTKLYRNGVKLNAGKLGIRQKDESVRYRVFADDRTFIGLAFVKDDCLRVFKNFA